MCGRYGCQLCLAIFGIGEEGVWIYEKADRWVGWVCCGLLGMWSLDHGSPGVDRENLERAGVVDMSTRPGNVQCVFEGI